MKSKRAKEYAIDQEFNSVHGGALVRADYEHSIALAEQDAEERAVECFCKATCSSSPCEDSCDDFIEFKQLLNGGQSNNNNIEKCSDCIYYEENGCRAFIEDKTHYDKCMATIHESKFAKCKPKLVENENPKNNHSS